MSGPALRMRCQAILLDFDGLILDTETPDVEAWEAIYAEYGFEYPKENWSQNIGGWGVSTFDAAENLQRLSAGASEAPNAPSFLPLFAIENTVDDTAKFKPTKNDTETSSNKFTGMICSPTCSVKNAKIIGM